MREVANEFRTYLDSLEEYEVKCLDKLLIDFNT